MRDFELNVGNRNTMRKSEEGGLTVPETNFRYFYFGLGNGYTKNGFIFFHGGGDRELL